MLSSPNRSSSLTSSAVAAATAEAAATRDYKHHPAKVCRTSDADNSAVAMNNPINRARGRRESRPITSIATTTTTTTTMTTTTATQPSATNTLVHGSRQGVVSANSPAITRTEDTTFSLPI